MMRSMRRASIFRLLASTGLPTRSLRRPSTDTIPGQDSFIQLAGRDRDAMLMVKDVALAMNFGRGSEAGWPG